MGMEEKPVHSWEGLVLILDFNLGYCYSPNLIAVKHIMGPKGPLLDLRPTYRVVPVVTFTYLLLTRSFKD